MAKKAKKSKRSVAPRKTKAVKSKAKIKVKAKPSRHTAKVKPVSSLKVSIGPRIPFRTPKLPVTDDRPLTENQVQKFRDILSQKREELLDVVQRKKEQEIQAGEAEIGDEADIATRSVEKEILFELTDTEKQTLDMIEASLRKIEKGVFGQCESCRKYIPRLRLEVMPWARYCIHCQSEQEIPVPEPLI